MKTRYGLLMATLVLFASALLPSPARAEEPTDCTQGCYVVICAETICSLWRCDAKGCRFLSNWPKEWSDGPMAAAGPGKSAASPPPVAYAKVCPDDRQCDLYEITVDQALRIGSFDNAADLVRDREQMRGAGRKPH